MSDFQYLAMHSGPDGKQTSMYDKVLMLKPEKEEFYNRELPLYIPPPIFSRLDTPIDYFYRPDIHHRSVLFLMRSKWPRLVHGQVMGPLYRASKSLVLCELCRSLRDPFSTRSSLLRYT